MLRIYAYSLLVLYLFSSYRCSAQDVTYQEGNNTWVSFDEVGEEEPAHYRLMRFLMTGYKSKLLPRRLMNQSVIVRFTIGLHQIIEVNEPQQYVILNSWVVERWTDELLYWDPADYDGLTQIVLPADSVWIPDTTLYNSLVMNNEESRRVSSVKVTARGVGIPPLVEFLYPTLYKFSCMLDLR
ncbi:mutant ACR-23-like protein [Aphelenchoides avenae]|nr:mutant ACR-23-like protein [Aphelenchus avenae]